MSAQNLVFSIDFDWCLYNVRLSARSRPQRPTESLQRSPLRHFFQHMHSGSIYKIKIKGKDGNECKKWEGWNGRMGEKGRGVVEKRAGL